MVDSGARGYQPPAPSLHPGSTIGPYTLLQPLGEGGMGEVWEAEQREPIRRHVALKLLKLGLDTKAFLARFEIERQALAVMDHPNIAKVLEAGTTPVGRPFYVMELVRGIPLTDFCDNLRLPTADRLRLFAEVCRAVQHAHQKGVIHRDLKPSNILVTQVDDRPVPKVIDFGIAKAIGGHFTDVTFVTEIGRPMGTPAYMSPEQWEPGQLDIDTRADVYSLGVILYELLVGRLPTDPERMLRAGAAIAQLIREITPAAPSTRVRSLGDVSASLARARGTDARTLARELKGDLDWITLKAMDPDRSRRYETAHAMVQDIGRHLQAEPVAARPPSLQYRAGRFVRRHRTGVAVATIALVSGIAFTGLTLRQARRVAVERDRAQREAARAGALNDFLQRTLLSPDPIDGFGRQTTMLEALDSAAARLAREAPRLPGVEASMASAIGWAFFKLAAFDRAEPLLRRALAIRQGGPVTDSLRLAESLTRLGALMDARAASDSAATLYTAAIALLRAHASQGSDDLAFTLMKAGRLLAGRNDTTAARQAYAEARAIYATAGDSLGLAAVDDHEGEMAFSAEDYSAAAASFRRSLAVREPRLGRHPLVANSLQNLALALERMGQPLAAESVYRRALTMAEATLGPRHEVVSAIATNLGSLLGDGGRAAEAEQLMQRAIGIDEQTYGRDHPFVAADLTNLARLLCRSGNAPEGEGLARRAARIFERSEGAESWQVGMANVLTGACLTARRKFPEAEAQLTTGLRRISKTLGATHWRADTARVRLRELYHAWGRPAPADSVDR